MKTSVINGPVENRFVPALHCRGVYFRNHFVDEEERIVHEIRHQVFHAEYTQAMTE